MPHCLLDTLRLALQGIFRGLLAEEEVCQIANTWSERAAARALPATQMTLRSYW